MNLSCFAFLQNDHRLRRSVRVFMSRTPHWSFLPKTCQWTGINKALIELVNVARVKGFSLAYLHVIHFETSRFNIKSFARVLLLFFRSFPVHLENYPECILRTIGWARGLSMLKLYLKQSFIQLRAKCNKSLWIMPGLWLPVWLQCRPYRMSRWTNVQIF